MNSQVSNHSLEPMPSTRSSFRPLAPSFDRSIQLEPPFSPPSTSATVAKPVKSTHRNALLAKSADQLDNHGTYWQGADRRSATRPWQRVSASPVQGAQDSMFDGSCLPTDVDPTTPIDREQQNRSLIGAYLSQALGVRSGADNYAPSAPRSVQEQSNSLASNETLDLTQPVDRENVVVFKRAAS
jgi:hypothetical protein